MREFKENAPGTQKVRTNHLFIQIINYETHVKQ
jgi:hypothetical protein